MDKPEKERAALLPSKRVQVDYQPEALTRNPRRIAKFPSQTHQGTHRTIRSRTYTRSLTVRAEVVADDEAWLERFIRDFLLAMPHKTADGDGNLITVVADRAVLGGFEGKMVEAFKRRSSAVHVTVTGMLCKDTDVPLVTDVNLVDGVTAN